MPEQTFRSPNFFEREIDLSAPTGVGPSGTPAGIIGTANKGPAFVPVTVGTFNEYQSVFGGLDVKRYGTYAVNEYLKHKSALTYMRVLGAGANTSDTDISTTGITGRVKNAGVKIEGTVAADDSGGRHVGAVQFLVANHVLQSSGTYGLPIFDDNDSYTGSQVKLVRGMVVMASTARMMVLGGATSAVGQFTAAGPNDSASLSGGVFKLVISSTLGNSFANTDGNPGVQIYSASFNPTSPNYFGKLLNTDPDQFEKYQHVLYADFSVDDELASADTVGIVSGSSNTSTTSGELTTVFRNAFGAFDTRYKTPSTPYFISQPFGATEYDLFKVESIDDGEYANKLYKVSIANIKASPDDTDPYGTFTLQIRDWNDTDINPMIIESFPNCSLNPIAENYIARLVGDRKVTYNFDATSDDERRLVATGKYPNKSAYVRVVMSDAVESGIAPKNAVPFGFHGHELLKTNDSLTDVVGTNSRLSGKSAFALTGSILPPIPHRFKVTKGEIPMTWTWPGEPSSTELASSQFYWGVKFERNTLPTNSNLASEKNALLESLTKFLGIRELDTLVTGSGADTFNNNKFTLAKVALSNSTINDLTASLNDHMKEAAYIRNGKVDLSTYTINDGVIGDRITFATLLSKGSAAQFNKFSPYAKFTTFMAGGYDGLNFLDRDARRMNDKSVSFDPGGGAEASYLTPGLVTNPAGTGQNNSNVRNYMTAIDIMTDPMVVNTNILAIPGIREPFVADYAMKKTRDYGLAFYVMDIPAYDDSANRLYDDSTARPSVDQTASQLDSRSADNSFVGTYFPDVFIDDASNRRKVKVPASVAALGALAFNDRVAYPWFAPAGFNRAALDFVSNVGVRLNVSDRDRLYDSRINPIATFPRLGFVIYGQKTLQISKSALDRVNVRRLLLEVKRIIIDIANKLVFEQNTPETRNKFVADSAQQLSLIQAQAGVEAFKIVCNETNNTQDDVDNYRMNAKVVIVPTRVIEYIAIDFIITRSGIQFV